MDSAKRRQPTQQIDRLVPTDAYVLPVHWLVFQIAWWPNVKGFAPQSITYYPAMVMETVWLDE